MQTHARAKLGAAGRFALTEAIAKGMTQEAAASQRLKRCEAKFDYFRRKFELSMDLQLMGSTWSLRV